MTAFTELGLSKDALKAVDRLGYTDPTPVQEQAIPLVLEGRDLIAAASTGTGKTAAFLLPILSTLPRAGRGRRAPRVLVVTPTRELAQQISSTCIKIARATGHFATTVYGGTSYSPQIRELRGGTDVLIATPGRLKDLMERGVADLGSIQVLVLDEADRMLDMGFLPDVTDIVEATPRDRQTLLFSATIDKSIENNLGSLLNDPAVVQIAHKGETAATVAQFIMPIAQRDKAELLRAVLEEKGSQRVIVFVRTRNRTEDCAEMLRDAGFSAESIHSDKSQAKRRRALESFRRGKVDILVATDVLARGIDVTGVDHVINYDLPDMPEDYVHRIGRTGRAGEDGYAISFVSPDTKRLLRDVEHLINREIPLMELETYDLDPSILTKGGKGGKGRSSRKRGSAQGKRHERSSAESRSYRSGKFENENRSERHGNASFGDKHGKASFDRDGKGAHRPSSKEEFHPKSRKERRAEQFADRRDDRAGNRSHERSYDRAETYFADRRESRPYDRSRGDRSYGRSYDDRSYERRENRSFDRSDDRSRNRSYGRSYDDRSYGNRSYDRKDSRSYDRRGDRSYDRRDNDRSYDDRSYNRSYDDRSYGNRAGDRSQKRNGNRKESRSFGYEGNRSQARFSQRPADREESRFDDRRGNHSNHRGSRGKGSSSKHQKNRPANIVDVRSFGEHKARRANSKHNAVK